MARYYILASHGRFAAGIKDSLELILGQQPHLFTLCAYVQEQHDLQEQISSLFNDIATEDELIVITDVFGGSVNNMFMQWLTRRHFHLLSGLNLPLLLNLFTNDEQPDTDILIQQAISQSQEAILYCNPLLGEMHSVNDDKDF